MAELRFTLNGKPVATEAHPMARLLDVLRGPLGQTGTKEGCGEGECGACAVLVDGTLVNSCLVPAIQARGADVRTVEGIAGGGELTAIQRSFLAHGAAQCGICTPGMLLAAVSLLEQNPSPSEDEIRTALAGNLCRCTGYGRIVQAIAEAARAR